MRAETIAKYLRPFRIASRWTTFNGAAQHALAVHDTFDAKRIATLCGLLGQDSKADLTCVYCGSSATTWDHLHPNVLDKRYAGFGNRIFNLVPACDFCNERKGNKHWSDWLIQLGERALPDAASRLTAVDAENHAESYPWSKIVSNHPDLAAEYERALLALRAQIDTLDELARQIRERIVRELAGTEE